MGDFAAHDDDGYTARDLPGSTIQSKSKTLSLNRKAHSLDLPTKHWMQEWTSRRTSLLVPTTPVEVQYPFYPHSNHESDQGCEEFLETEVLPPPSWSTSNQASKKGEGDWEGYQQLEEKRQEREQWGKEPPEDERREMKTLEDARREMRRLEDERQERQRLEDERQERKRQEDEHHERKRQEEEHQRQEDERLDRRRGDEGWEKNGQEKHYREDDRVIKVRDAAEMARKEERGQLEQKVGEAMEQVEGVVETEEGV